MREETRNPYQSPLPLREEAVVSNRLFDGRLSTVGLGLKLVYWGILLMLMTWISIIPVAMFVEQAVGLQWIFIGLTLLSTVLINFGPILCLTVPTGFGLRPWAVATLLTQILVIGGLVLQALTMGFPVFSGMWVFLSLGGLVFLAFLYQLAKAIERKDLMSRCRNILIFGLVLIVGGIVLLLAMMSYTPNANFAMLLYLLLLFFLFVLVVAYANVVNSIAKSIQEPRGLRSG